MSFPNQALDDDLHCTFVIGCQQNHSGFADDTAQNTASSPYLFSTLSLKLLFLEPLIVREGKKPET